MSLFFMRFPKIILVTCSTAAIITMCCISLFIYHTSILNLLLFFLFIVVYVQIPGLLLLNFANANIKHVSEELLISFFLGWALVVTEYFVFNFFKLKFLLYAFGPLLSIVYIYICHNEPTYCAFLGRLKLKRIPSSFVFANSILMLYVFLNTQFLYIRPDLSRYISISIDKAYQAGLISALSRGYPLISPWVSGVFEHYHIFTQVFLSVPATLFSLSSDFIVMSCCPFMTVYLLGLSFYALFKHFASNKDRAGLYTLSVILSSMFIAVSASKSYIFRILFINDNYGGFAVSCLIACVIVLDWSINFDRHSHYKINADLIRYVALIMLLSGIKAPVALVLIGGITGTYILSLFIDRKDIGKRSFIEIVSLVSFFIVFMFLIGNDSTSGISNSSVFTFGKITNLCFWKKPLIDFLKSVNVNSPMRLLIILLVFFIFYFSVYALPLAIGFLREFVLVLSKKKNFSFVRVTLYASTIVGFTLMMFLRYDGHSQVYFGTVATTFAPIIGFWFFEDQDAIRNKLVRVFYKFSKLSFFIMLVATTLALTADIYSLIPTAIVHSHADTVYNPYTSLSRDEYEAMQWIKNNTPENSLLATQMYYSVNKEEYNPLDRWNNCHFLYAAYSNRNYYLEGSGFTLENDETSVRLEMINNNDALYDPSNSNRLSHAKKLGINYLVVTKKFDPQPDLTANGFEKVFSNYDIDIYKVNSSY